MGRVLRVSTLFCTLVAMSSSAIAGDANGAQINNVKFQQIGNILFSVLVLSVVFETALTTLFNWRIFLRYAEGRGVKTPLTVGLAFFFFWGFDIDIISQILDALTSGTDTEPQLGGQILTALLIAGGSDGVFRIFTRLQIRNPAERMKKAREERKPATVVFKLSRTNTEGPVTIYIDDVVNGEIPPSEGTFELDGVAPGKHDIRLEGHDESGQPKSYSDTIAIAPGVKFTKRIDL